MYTRLCKIARCHWFAIRKGRWALLGLRMAALVVCIAVDLLLIPAVARLPQYLSLTPGQAERMGSWRQEWLYQPVRAGTTLVRRSEPSDRQALQVWLSLQFLVGAVSMSLVWPGRRQAALAARGVPAPDLAGTHGTAQWRTRRELAHTLTATPIRRANPPQGFMVGVDDSRRPGAAYQVSGPLSPAPINPHVLVIGSSGSGKTRRLVLPNLWLLGRSKAAGHPNSILVTDPKAELYRYTAAYFRSLGYQVRTLNLIDPRHSDGYDPLREIVGALERGDLSGAAEGAWDAGHAFSTVESTRFTREEPIWRQGSESLIAATILYVATHAPSRQRTMGTVYRLIAEYGQDGGALLDLVFRSTRDLTHPARLAYAVTGLAQDRTRSSILTTVAAHLRLFSDPNVVAMTSQSDYDLASIGQQPTVVYLLLPDDRSSRNAIAAMYLAQAYSALARLAAQSPGGRLPVPVYWILDEFANLGQFRDWDKWISVMRGRGMAAMMVIQAMQQLEARYGPDVARVITSNCDTWLLLRTNDRLTAREISEKLGQYTIRLRGASATTRRWEVSTGTSEHLTGRPLLTPDEVLRWPMGEALVLQAGHHPARLRLADISVWPVQLHEGEMPPVRKDEPLPAPWLPGVELPSRTVKAETQAQTPSQSAGEEGRTPGQQQSNDLEDLAVE